MQSESLWLQLSVGDSQQDAFGKSSHRLRSNGSISCGPKKERKLLRGCYPEWEEDSSEYKG